MQSRFGGDYTLGGDMARIKKTLLKKSTNSVLAGVRISIVRNKTLDNP